MCVWANVKCTGTTLDRGRCQVVLFHELHDRCDTDPPRAPPPTVLAPSARGGRSAPEPPGSDTEYDASGPSSRPLRNGRGGHGGGACSGSGGGGSLHDRSVATGVESTVAADGEVYVDDDAPAKRRLWSLPHAGRQYHHRRPSCPKERAVEWITIRRGGCSQRCARETLEEARRAARAVDAPRPRKLVKVRNLSQDEYEVDDEETKYQKMMAAEARSLAQKRSERERPIADDDGRDERLEVDDGGDLVEMSDGEKIQYVDHMKDIGIWDGSGGAIASNYNTIKPSASWKRDWSWKSAT